MHLSRNDEPKIDDNQIPLAVKTSVIQPNHQYQRKPQQPPTTQRSQLPHQPMPIPSPKPQQSQPLKPRQSQPVAQSSIAGKNFECPLCGAKCADTSDLISHLRIHCDLN